MKLSEQQCNAGRALFGADYGPLQEACGPGSLGPLAKSLYKAAAGSPEVSELVGMITESLAAAQQSILALAERLTLVEDGEEAEAMEKALTPRFSRAYVLGDEFFGLSRPPTAAKKSSDSAGWIDEALATTKPKPLVKGQSDTAHLTRGWYRPKQ